MNTLIPRQYDFGITKGKDRTTIIINFDYLAKKKDKKKNFGK
jgi:hypothetical protein